MELQLRDIQSKIYEIRGCRVMLDYDLSKIFEVETSALKRAVRRNMERFPADFMFELSNDEYNDLKIRLRCQFGTLEIDDNRGKYPKYPPFAFTEHGIAMLSGELHSPIAIQANINIMRAFVAVREYLLARASESVEIAQLRERVLILEQASEASTEHINNLYAAIDELSAGSSQLDPNRRLIGFNRGNE